MLTNLHNSLLLLVICCCFCYGQKTNDSLYLQTEQIVEQKPTEEAFTTSLQQIQLAPSNSSQKAKWLQLAGIIFKKNEEYDTSLKYLKQSYYINQHNQDSLALMLNHLHIGQIFQEKFNVLYGDKKHFSKKATRLKDSAAFYYLKNISEFKNVPSSLKYIGAAHINLSYLHSNLNELDKAKEHINKAINIYKNNEQLYKNALNTSLLNLGLIYIFQEDYKLAEETNLNLLSRIKDTSELKPLVIYHQSTLNLAYIYKKTKKYEKAFEYYNKEKKLLEIISERQKATEIRRIEAKHNVANARKEEQINTLREKKAKERMYLWSGIGGLTALGIILFGSILYRNSKLKAKNLALSLVQQELNKQQELKQLQIQNQSKVLSATLDGREKERKDIAQTLHDSVSALLSSVSMHIQVAKKKTTTEIEELDKSHRILGEASDKVRDLSHQLLSAVLVKFGLAYAVDDMCEKYSNSELSLELECDEVIPRFEVDIEVKLKNIIEEFINNIIKHSKASIATVSLDYQNENLEIVITDNGVGFDTSIISPKSGGVGLSQIKARVESLGGTISIESTPKQGTNVNMIIPVKRRENA